MTLQPGTILLSTIDGRTGAFVKLGQRFMGAKKEDANWSHVAMIGEGGFVYEAMPPGVQRNPLSTYLDDLKRGDEVLFIDVPLTPEQRRMAVEASDYFVAAKIGYSFGTYFELFLKRLGVNTKYHKLLREDSRFTVVDSLALP